MGFFKRGKESKNEKYDKNNEQGHCDSDGVTSTEVEMQIDCIRPGYKSYDGKIIDLPEGVPFDYTNHVCLVLLKEIEGKRYLPMYIGGNDADAIAINLQHVVPPRPLTHDFLCAVIDLLGSSIKNVVINEIKNDTFYASARLACYGTFLDVDCRPSDALNVAVRLGAPILVTEEVLNIASIDLPDLQDIPDTSWLPR